MATLAPLLCWGCSSYQAKPLDASAVDAALKEPEIESVKISAASIKHPLVAPIVIDGKGGFTPDEVAVMAVIGSPELRALRDQRGVAQAQVIQAGILPNPTFNYELDRPNSYPFPVSSQVTEGLTWDISQLLSHHSTVAAAKDTARSLDLSIAWQEWQASQDARMRAFRILSLEERLPLLRSVEDKLSATVDDTKKAVAKGLLTMADLTLAVETWTNAQNVRFEVEGQLSDDQAALALSLGMGPGKAIPLKAGAPFPGMDGEQRTTLALLLQGIEERRLDLVALRYGYESQEQSVRSAVLQQFPKISVGFVHSKDNSSPQITSNGPSVSVDLPIFDRNQGQIKIAKATRQQLFDEYVARVAQARSDVGRLLTSISVLQEQVREADASIPDLQQLVDSTQKALKSRSGGYKEYNDSYAALATRLVERSQLRQQLLELEVALEVATGRPLLDRSPISSP